MAIICRKQKLLFIMTPRTACTALADVLVRELGGEYLPTEPILDEKGFFKVQSKHCTLSDLHQSGIITKEETDSYTKFTTVRNPFDSIVSRYEKLRSKYQPFIDDPESWVHKVPGFVDNMHYCESHSFNNWVQKTYRRTAIKRLLGGKPSMYRRFTDGMDAVIPFENIQPALDDFTANQNPPFKLEIPRINTTSERSADYRKYYNSTSRMIVQFALKDDFKNYGYSF